MSNKLKTIALVAIPIAVVAAFGAGVVGGFHWDDIHAILKNPSVKSMGAALASFVDPGAFSAYRLQMIRPLTIISYAINYKIGEFNPIGWHILNLLIHIAASLAVFKIAALLLKTAADEKKENLNYFAAFFAAMIFAVHPVQSETLNYFSARSALMSGAFCLFGLYFHLKFNYSRKYFYRLFAVLFFAFALFSREDASVFPALALAIDFILAPGIERENKKSRMLNGLPYWGLFFIYMIYRKAVLDVFAAEGYLRGPFDQIAIDVWAIGLYHKLILFPAALSVRHTAPAVFSGSAIFWFGICVVAAEISAFVFCYKRRPAISAAIAFFYIALSPTLVIPLNMAASEHRLYLPIFGAAVLAALFVKNIFARKIERAIIATCIVTITFIAFDLHDSARWRDEVSLWERETRRENADDTAWLQYGKALKDAGRTGEAVAAYRKSIDIKPTSGAYNNLSIACEITGDMQCAFDSMNSALKTDASDPIANMNYAIYLMQQNKFEEAELYLQTAIDNQEVFPEAHKNYAIALSKRQPQPTTEMLYHLKKSLDQDPYQDEGDAMRRMISEIEKSLNGGK